MESIQLLDEAVDIFLNDLMDKNLVCLLGGMVAIPEYVLRIIRTCPAVFVTQYDNFNVSRATATSVINLKPCNR